jgi:hypothetical protein
MAMAQAPNAPLVFADRDAIITTFVSAPSLNSGDAPPPAPGDSSKWLKVEFHYGTTAALKTKYLDAVEFKVWIEGFDPLATNSQGGTGVGVALTGSVTYINVPAGKDLYGVFYVHPSTLGRYSGDRGTEDYDRKFDVHLEASVGGTLVDEVNKNKEQDPLKWFQPLTVVPNLVYRQDQCPFLLSSPDRYPAIKLPAAAQ